MEKLPLDLAGPDPRRGLSTMSRGLIGSEILKIAAEIRVAQAAGKQIANFTVGDFSSKEFPIPALLGEATVRACTHLDVSREDCERAAAAIRDLT